MARVRYARIGNASPMYVLTADDGIKYVSGSVEGLIEMRPPDLSRRMLRRMCSEARRFPEESLDE